MLKNSFLFILLLFSCSQKKQAPTANIEQSEKIKIVFIGDSLTEGYGVTKSEAFPALLEEKLKKDGFSIEIINGGVSGSTSASAPRRMKWFLKSKPDIIFLALGANDGLRGVSVRSTKENLEKAIDMALKNGITIILAGMKLPFNYGEKYRSDFEKIFRDLSTKKDILFIPFLLKGVAGVKDLNQVDGIHPNAKGHQRMADYIYPFIKKAL